VGQWLRVLAYHVRGTGVRLPALQNKINKKNKKMIAAQT
jgi:hypothetical protein